MASLMLPGPGLPTMKSAIFMNFGTSRVKPSICIFTGPLIARSFSASFTLCPQIMISCTFNRAACNFFAMSTMMCDPAPPKSTTPVGTAGSIPSIRAIGHDGLIELRVQYHPGGGEYTRSEACPMSRACSTAFAVPQMKC